MKLVKEILYEKFTEDSDPVQDIGIGSVYFIKNWKKKIEDLDKKLVKERGIQVVESSFGKPVFYSEWEEEKFILEYPFRLGEIYTKSIIKNIFFRFHPFPFTIRIVCFSNLLVDNDLNIIHPSDYVEEILEKLNLMPFLIREWDKQYKHTYYKILPQYSKYFVEDES